MELDWSVIPDYFDLFMEGAGVTLVISLLAIGLGFMGGIFFGLGRISSNKVVYALTTVYVEIFRGTPLLIQILIIYFGLPSLGIQFSVFGAGVLALALNSAAYQAEIFRGGMQSIPSGQMEAARSMGLTYNQSMLHVIIPQGLRNAIPPFTNEFIIMIKDSSLVSAIGLFELTYTGEGIIGTTFQPFVVYLFIAAIYFVMTFTTALIMKRVEKKYSIPGTMGGI